MICTSWVMMLLATSATMVGATLNPASSNTQGKCPSVYNCSAAKTSKAIQAAECSHNTRTSTTQTFAVFVQDHQYDGNNGYPYGSCTAYTCTSPTSAQMEADEDCWTFFWSGTGESTGYGTDCIKSPDDGTCGCENSDGTFVYGGTSCV